MLPGNLHAPPGMQSLLLLILKNNCTVKTEQTKSLDRCLCWLALRARAAVPAHLLSVVTHQLQQPIPPPSSLPPHCSVFHWYFWFLMSSEPQSLQQRLPQSRHLVNTRRHFFICMSKNCSLVRDNPIRLFAAFGESERYMNILIPKRGVVNSSKEFA